MKRKLTQLLMLGGLLVAGCFNLLAQEKEPLPEKVKIEQMEKEAVEKEAALFDSLAQEKEPLPEKLKIERMEKEAAEKEATLFKVLSSKPAVGPVVKGAPYSATTMTERVQTLTDGNQIIRKNESKLYRDSAGRTRTEQTLEIIGKWTAADATRQLITITDPVAGWSVSLDPLTRTAHKNTYARKKDGRVVMNAEVEALKDEVEALKEKTGTTPQIIPSKDAKPWELQVGISGDPRRKIESLGKQMIEGVETVGTRATYTIPAGEIGNTLPIEIVEETWYSPELQLMVLTKSRDPRSGETTYRMTNLNRNEPDRALFEIPADYTVTPNTSPVKPKKIREDEQ